MLGHSNVRNVGRGDRSVCGHRFFALPLHPCKEKPCFSGKFREIKLYRIMYWTLELASKLEDAPWPATEIEDEGEIYESIEDIWPDYPSKDDFFFNEEEY